MDPTNKFSLVTKRLVIGHVTVCQGCCCGNVANGRPPVPVDWLKEEWRARGLLKRVQLSISGCLGPCDLPNVVTISDDSGTQWLGNNRVRPIPSYRRLGQPFQRCRCTPPSSQRISAAHATSIPLIEVCWKYAAGSVESGQVLVSRITV